MSPTLLKILCSGQDNGSDRWSTDCQTLFFPWEGKQVAKVAASATPSSPGYLFCPEGPSGAEHMSDRDRYCEKKSEAAPERIALDTVPVPNPFSLHHRSPPNSPILLLSCPHPGKGSSDCPLANDVMLRTAWGLSSCAFNKIFHFPCSWGVSMKDSPVTQNFCSSLSVLCILAVELYLPGG